MKKLIILSLLMFFLVNNFCFAKNKTGNIIMFAISTQAFLKINKITDTGTDSRQIKSEKFLLKTIALSFATYSFFNLTCQKDQTNYNTNHFLLPMSALFLLVYF